MNRAWILIMSIALAGCGVELLTTTAITSDLQAKQLTAMKGQIGRASEQTARVNLQRAIDTFTAEKGHYPASLAELAPGWIPTVPSHPDGSPFGYDATTGKLLDSPVPVSAGPTPGDYQKMNQIRGAIDQYGRAVGYYPPSLAALAPAYLAAVPKTDSGQDFIFYPQNGALFHPMQLAQQQPAPAPAPQPAVPRPVGVGGAGPMGEVMTGIGIQNQLNSMGSSATNSAGGYARRSVGGITDQHNQAQEKALRELGN